MTSSENAWDNLTTIAGIGGARQQWLREAFYIHTFKDLANLSVSQIEEKMKADGLIISRKAIEAWLAQARELANPAAEPSQPAAGLAAELSARRSNPMPRENGWKPFASFVVEYQTNDLSGQILERRTVAHHMELDMTMDWPGIEGCELCQWMLAQIHAKVAIPAEAALAQVEPAIARPAEKPTAVIKITHIRILQPAHPAAPVKHIEPGALLQVSVLRDEPFNLEVNFELVGRAAAEVSRQMIGWSVVCQAQDPVSATIRPLGDSGPNSLAEGQFLYKVVLPDISLHPGNYRLWVIVNSDQSTLVLPDFLDLLDFLVL